MRRTVQFYTLSRKIEEGENTLAGEKARCLSMPQNRVPARFCHSQTRSNNAGVKSTAVKASRDSETRALDPN
jgi:hypothetical protein